MNPIVLRLNLSLVGTPVASFGKLRPVLAADAQTLFTGMVRGIGWGEKGAGYGVVVVCVGWAGEPRSRDWPSWHSSTLSMLTSWLCGMSPPCLFSWPAFFFFFFWQFPFEKNCGNDSICQDDLSITFHPMR